MFYILVFLINIATNRVKRNDVRMIILIFYHLTKLITFWCLPLSDVQFFYLFVILTLFKLIQIDKYW